MPTYALVHPPARGRCPSPSVDSNMPFGPLHRSGTRTRPTPTSDRSAAPVARRPRRARSGGNGASRLHYTHPTTSRIPEIPFPALRRWRLDRSYARVTLWLPVVAVAYLATVLLRSALVAHRDDRLSVACSPARRAPKPRGSGVPRDPSARFIDRTHRGARLIAASSTGRWRRSNRLAPGVHSSSMVHPCRSRSPRVRSRC